MINDAKDSIANVTTIAGAGAAMIDWNSMLTMGLILTGIVLNILRIIEIRRRRKSEE